MFSSLSIVSFLLQSHFTSRSVEHLAPYYPHLSVPSSSSRSSYHSRGPVSCTQFMPSGVPTRDCQLGDIASPPPDTHTHACTHARIPNSVFLRREGVQAEFEGNRLKRSHYVLCAQFLIGFSKGCKDVFNLLNSPEQVGLVFPVSLSVSSLSVCVSVCHQVDPYAAACDEFLRRTQSDRGSSSRYRSRRR